MKSIEIIGTARSSHGKKDAKKLRKSDNIPCILYGGKEVKSFYAIDRAFKELIYTPRVVLVDLVIEGVKHKALLQEVQYHPVSDHMLHVDFLEIFDDKYVVIGVPVKTTGASIGVKEGGKLRQIRRKVKVKALPANLPDVIEINVTDMEIGKTVSVGDLKMDKVEFLDAKNSAVVTVLSSRAAMKGTDEEAALLAAAAAAAAAATAAEGAAAPAADAAKEGKEGKEGKEKEGKK